MDKQTLRKWAKETRKGLDMAALSSVLAEGLLQSEVYKNSKNIMLFYPLEGEVNLLSLLSDTTKQFYLPRVNGQVLECCEYKDGDELCESCFHTLEPTCKPCEVSGIDLIIIPALACDRNKYRLGYGKGYYDRFLSTLSGVKKVVCIPSKLVVDTVYPEEHDIKADLIITELFSC